jgi:GT2 family glycosyltransferase
LPLVVAVVVSYNRRDLLRECLQALQSQSRVPDAVVIVDNASTDGSAQAARETFPTADVVRLDVNTGGAGGFAIGISRAIEHHAADAVWIMDDDTVPQPTALETLLHARSLSPKGTSVFASRVVWNDGLDHPMNTPRPKPVASRVERRVAAAAGAIPVRSASFVSLLVDAGSVRRVGLPVAEYFIWNDDFEFTARVLRRERGLFVPASVAVHKTKARADTDVDPGDRFYFEVRNKVWLLTRSPALKMWERPLYMASAARRWLRTYSGSSDRRRLRVAFQQGLRDAIRSAPEKNSRYLAQLGVLDTCVAAFEPRAAA